MNTLKAKKKPRQTWLAPTLWALAGAVILLIPVRVLFATRFDVSVETGDFLLYILLVSGALMLPAIGLYMQARWPRNAILDTGSDPVLLVLSGLAGLAVWVIAWWGMSFLDEQVLVDTFGFYLPLSIYLPAYQEPVWGWLIIFEVVLIPLIMMVLFWGILRYELQGLSVSFQVGLSGIIFGMVAVWVTGQGIVGLWGYSLCGMVATFVSIRAQTMWAGFTTHAVFMYANHTFLVDLLREVNNEAYLGMTWLTYVLLSGLGLIIVLQIIRFRGPDAQEVPVHNRAKLNVVSLLALIALLFMLLPLVVDELEQRSDAPPALSTGSDASG